VIRKYWRELVDSRTAMAELNKNGVSIKELRERITDIGKLRSNGIDVDKALRDADVVGAINRAMMKPGQPPASTLAILDAIERGNTGPGPRVRLGAIPLRSEARSCRRGSMISW
jgi:hypothetical protein